MNNLLNCPRTLEHNACTLLEELYWMRSLIRAQGIEHFYGHDAALTHAIEFADTIMQAARDAAEERSARIHVQLQAVQR